MKTIELLYGITVELDGEGNGNITSDLAEEFGHLATDILESLILAQACAGIDIDSDAYRESLLTCLDAIGNNMDFEGEDISEF